MDPVVARQMWRTLEPYHGWIYFAPEAREAYAALGVTHNRMGYFGSRSAPMGAVPAEVVIATFYNFHPELVRRSIPEVWSITTPGALLRARLEAADSMLRRVLGEQVDSPEMAEAAALARTAAEACTPEGRPLYAGHASLEWPDGAHLVLWHALTLLREYRGDGHIAALAAAGIDACEALVTHAGAGEVGAEVLQRSRAWPDDEWQATVERLRSRGLVDADGGLTDLGHQKRQAVEGTTDQLAMGPWTALGEEACRRLRHLVRPWSKALVAGGPPRFDLD